MIGAVGAERPRRGRVQKQRNNSSAPIAEPSKWARVDWLHANSKQKRLRLCGVAGSGGDVVVGRRGSEATVAGVLRCGSRICPECGPRIAAETREQMRRTMEWWTSKPHGKLWFGTLTLRHRLDQDYGLLLDAVQECWQAATGGRGWMRDREQYGIAHSIRVIEEKWSVNFGWHVHVHFVLFIDTRADCAGGVSGLLSSMFLRWSRRADALGLAAPLLRGQDLHEVTTDGAADRLSRYFAKQSTSVSDPDAMSWEMTAGEQKKGRASLTAGQILAWAIAGELYVGQLWGRAREGERVRGEHGQAIARLLWEQYESARKGRRVIAWSRGLREAAGVREMTDAELLEQAEAREVSEDRVQLELLAAVPPREWRHFRAGRGRMVALAEAVASGMTGAELVVWFSGYGVHAMLARDDRFGGSAVWGTPAELDAMPLPF
jgi:hypothetical protein